MLSHLTTMKEHIIKMRIITKMRNEQLVNKAIKTIIK